MTSIHLYHKLPPLSLIILVTSLCTLCAKVSYVSLIPRYEASHIIMHACTHAYLLIFMQNWPRLKRTWVPLRMNFHYWIYQKFPALTFDISILHSLSIIDPVIIYTPLYTVLCILVININ